MTVNEFDEAYPVLARLHLIAPNGKEEHVTAWKA